MRVNFVIESQNNEKPLYLINEIRDYLYSQEFSFIYKQIPDYLLPFSYCVFETNNKKQNFRNQYILNFATTNYELIGYIYNFILNSKEYRLIWAEIKRDRKITTDNFVFKTLTPIILDINIENWYLNNDTDLIRENMYQIVNSISEYFLKVKLNNFEFKLIDFNKIAVKIDENIFQGFNGVFEIIVDERILNLIYKIGLGYKKDYGFGMLEIINKKLRRNE